MVTPQPKDGHPPEESVVQTWNLALRFNSQNKSQVSTSMDGHLPSLGWSHTIPRMVTHQKEVYYRHGIWHLNSTKLTKPKMGNNFNEWSPILPRMVTHQAKNGHPSEGSILQTWNLAHRLNSQDWDQVTTVRNGHLPSQGWSPPIQRWSPTGRKYTNNLALWLNSQNNSQATISLHGHLPSLGWSTNNPRMVTNQLKDGHPNKEVYYRLSIWHLHIAHKTNTRWQLPWMVTYNP